MSEPMRMPIFPLGVVLLPGMNMPLHIFEERYKEMIGFCLSSKSEFGIVNYDGGRMKSAGCLAGITRILKRYPDGRLDIMTRGSKRFEIEEVYEENSYLEARITCFDDADAEETLPREELIDEAVQLLEEISGLSEEQKAMFSEGLVKPQKLSFLIAASEGFTAEEKQRFLEMRSTSDRLEKGVEALKQLMERIQINLEIKRIIGGNGHLPELLT